MPSESKSRTRRPSKAAPGTGNASDVSAIAKESDPDSDSGPNAEDFPESALEALVASAELKDVRVTKSCVDLISDASLDDVEAEFDVKAAFRRRPEGFDCKFDVAARLKRAGGQEIVKFEVDVVVSFNLEKAPDDLDSLIPPFLSDVGFFVAFPFIREALQSMSVRVGLPPLTLGLLRRGSEAPLTATFRTRGPSERV